MLKIKYFNSRTLDCNDAIQNDAIKSKIRWSSFLKMKLIKLFRSSCERIKHFGPR